MIEMIIFALRKWNFNILYLDALLQNGCFFIFLKEKWDLLALDKCKIFSTSISLHLTQSNVWKSEEKEKIGYRWLTSENAYLRRRHSTSLLVSYLLKRNTDQQFLKTSSMNYSCISFESHKESQGNVSLVFL